jgi:hypothetical protein
MKSRFDFGISLKLVSMNIEIRALEDGYELISSTIAALQESEVNRLEQTLALDKTLDQEDIISLHSDVNDNVEIFYPRLFWGTFLISVYSVLESSLKELGELLREELGCELKIDDLNGDFLEKANLYFSKVLKVGAINKSSCWETITQLRTVRNYFAHSNGRVGYKLPDNKKIRQIINGQVGVTHHMDVLIVNQQFVKTSMDSVVKFIKELQDEYRAIWNKNRAP